MMPCVGDVVRFEKSGIAISGWVKKVEVSHVDEETGVTWVSIKFATKSEYIVKEGEIEIVRHAARAV